MYFYVFSTVHNFFVCGPDLRETILDDNLKMREVSLNGMKLFISNMCLLAIIFLVHQHLGWVSTVALHITCMVPSWGTYHHCLSFPICCLFSVSFAGISLHSRISLYLILFHTLLPRKGWHRRHSKIHIYWVNKIINVLFFEVHSNSQRGKTYFIIY